MLSIAKLRVGSEAYQLTGVAQSLDDYYSGAGEAAGWWAGTGAERLELAGEVAGVDLQAVLAGIDPRTGGLSPNGETIGPHARRVPGFDLTFKAPKSVSVLYAISDDPRVQGAVIEAGETALRATLAWLEREAMAVRRGSDDRRYLANLAATDPAAADAKRLRTLRGADLMAAVFRHRTSRAGDPLLHWHVLVPNLVRGSDGRWSAFVHPDLYRMATAAGEVFQAALRDQLTATLGIRWRPGRHVPEVDGVPDAVCRAFSKRSAEVEAWLQAHGRGDDPAARQEAILATRRGKAELEGERFDTAWKLEGARLGFGPDQIEQLLAEYRPAPTPVTAVDEVWRLPELAVGSDGVPCGQDRTVTAEEWIADLLERDLVTSDATFTAADLYRAVAHRLGDGATVATIDRIAARVQASPQVIPVHTTGTGPSRRWTSAAMVAAERRLLDAFDTRDTRTPIPAELVDQVTAAHPSLGADQRHAVHTLAACPDPVAVLVGPAGTGKTYTLAVLRHAAEQAGLTVVGAAPSARAAVELEAGAGIPSHTLHALHRRWSRPGQGPDTRTLLVVDETAMAATLDLEPLLTRTLAAGGRVVLVGDHRQLPEIGPGGALAAATRVRHTAELRVNRRQLAPWEHDALAELRAGSVPAAVAAYRDHGRVVVTDDHETMLTAAVDRYLDALHAGLRPVLMAGTNDTVHRLNWTVRHRLGAHGALDLGQVAGVCADRPLVIGEQVVLRRNAHLTQPDGTVARVRNSDVATILGPSPGDEVVVRRHNDGAELHLDAGYLAGGYVDYGYAVTAHRAQGGTWDQAIAVGADGLYREAAYVQLSRGRASNWLIIPRQQMAELAAELARHDTGIPLPDEQPPDTLDDLVARLHTSRAKHLALTRDPDADHVAALTAEWTLPELEARAAYCRTVEQDATRRIGIDPDVLTRAVERAQHTAHHIALGQQVKAFDRRNIGTVTGIDDTTGTVHVRFRAHTGHVATRTLPWTEVQIVDRDLPPARVLPPVAQQHRDQLTDRCERTLHRWRHHLAAHGVLEREAHRCERAVQLHIDRAAHQLTAEPPVWLTDLLGARPDTAHGAHLWDHAVHVVAHHRLLHHLADHVPGIGSALAGDPAALCQRQQTSRQLLETRTQLDHLTPAAEPWPRLRTRSELVQRVAELDAILATAPPDQRDLLDRLADPDQPTLLDTAQALTEALATQGERREWILEHWPHVIEHRQVHDTLATGRHAPDLPALRASLLASDVGPTLRQALQRREPWIDRALCHLAAPDDTELDPPARQTLEQIADYRAVWGITGDQRLGAPPRHPAQARARSDLLHGLDLEGMRDPALRAGIGTATVYVHDIPEPASVAPEPYPGLAVDP